MGRGAARRATLRAAQGREATQGYDLYLVGGSLCLALPSYIIIATLRTSGSDVQIGLVTYLYLMIVKALCPAQVMLFFLLVRFCMDVSVSCCSGVCFGEQGMETASM